MPSYLYNKKELRKMKKKGENPFRSTSPSEALKQIEKKYGKRTTGYFYHRGKGEWTKYDVTKDIKIKHKRKKVPKKLLQKRHLADYKKSGGI